MTDVTPDERAEMAKAMVELSQEISVLVEQKNVDPGQLMRLTAAGVAQCLVAQAIVLNGGGLPDA